MKFDVKKIVALVLTLALVVTTITFTAGNSLKANELDDQQLGPQTEQSEVSVSQPEEKADATVKDASGSAEQEEMMEEEDPAVQEQTLKIAESKDNNSKKQIYIHNDGHLSYDSFYLVYGGGTVHFTKSNGDKYQSDSSAEGLVGDRVIQDGNNNELGTITLIKHGNGNNQNAGHAMDQYWISDFAPYEPSTPDPELEPEPEPFAISVSADVMRTTYSGLPNSVTAKPSVAEGTTVYYSTDNGATWSTSVPSITDVGVLYVKVKAENPESTNKVAYGNYFIQVQPAHVVVKTKQRYEKNAGEPDPVFEATVSGLVNNESESLIKYNIDKFWEDWGTGAGYIVKPYGDVNQGNYWVSYETHPLIIKGKTPLKITATGYNGTYDGKAHGEAATVARSNGEAAPAGTKIEYSLDGGETWSGTVPQVTDVKDSTVVQVRAICEDFDTVYESYSLVVSPKEVRVKANDITVMYGVEIPELTATVGETVNYDNVEYALTRKEGTDVGEYVITFTDPQENQGNYKVIFEDGKLVISPAGQVPISGEDYIGIYDGKEHSAAVTSADGAAYKYSTDNGQSWTEKEPAYKHAGEYTYQVKAVKKGYTDSEAITVSVTIQKKEIQIESGSANKKYDGKALKNSEIYVTGLVDGEYFTVAATGEQTEVGTSENTIEYAFGEIEGLSTATAAAKGNYEITSVTPGTLTVEPAEKDDPAPTPAPAPTPGSGNDGGNGNVLVAQGTDNGVNMTEVASENTPLANGVLDSHCCILHLLIILAALLMLFWYTTDMKRRQERIFELEEEINGKE